VVVQLASTQSAANPRAPERLGCQRALNGLRGIAVLLVIGIHVGLLSSGYLGVDVFFPLSGLLITALLYEEWESTGTVSLRRFYRRRLRRLLPALLTLVSGFTLVVVLLHPFDGLWPVGRLAGTTLLFANNWVSALVPGHGQVLGALSPTWTLGEETQFYLLWPPVLLILLRHRARPTTVLALLSLAIVLLVALAVVMRDAYADYNGYTSPLDRGAELLVGCAAAIVWRERLLPARLRHPAVGWLSAGGLVLVIAGGGTPHRWWYFSAAFLAAVLIVNLLGADRPSAEPGAAQPPAKAEYVLNRLLGSRPLRCTGKLSYGIYLYHLPIYYLVWTYVPGRPHYVYAMIVLIASIAAAALSWKLIESPILRRGFSTAAPETHHIRVAAPLPRAAVSAPAPLR
jgi:peptidoglycan/LPS O-acetylase OafA/YrhL